MCRKKYMHGWCMICFGLGLLVGHCMGSWLLCGCGGLCLVVLGFTVTRRR